MKSFTPIYLGVNLFIKGTGNGSIVNGFMVFTIYSGKDSSPKENRMASLLCYCERNYLKPCMQVCKQNI